MNEYCTIYCSLLTIKIINYQNHISLKYVLLIELHFKIEFTILNLRFHRFKLVVNLPRHINLKFALKPPSLGPLRKTA